MFSVSASAALNGHVRNEHQVNEAFRIIRLEHTDQASAWSQRHVVWMNNVNPPAIGKMNDERPKRLGVTQLFNFFDRHRANLNELFICRKPAKNPLANRPAGFAKFQFD